MKRVERGERRDGEGGERVSAGGGADGEGMEERRRRRNGVAERGGGGETIVGRRASAPNAALTNTPEMGI